MKVLEKANLHVALQKLAELGQVYVPAKTQGLTRFVPYKGNEEICLEENTLLSPKEILLPAMEKLYRYESIQGHHTVDAFSESAGSFIIFGIRSCDVQAITCLDDVFLRGEFVDEFYRSKRENASIIAISCTKPGAYCFCRSMGLNPQTHRGADLQIYDCGNIYGLEAYSDKGEWLLKELEKSSVLDDSQSFSALPTGEFHTQIEVAGIENKLPEVFENPLWDELGSKCLNCGICTYLCPACHCFDLADKQDNAFCGSKVRCWDSCMFSGYTAMAGGFNPRPEKKDRVRQRFMHKLCYFPQRYGKYLCTGCGRCLAKCPVGLEITQVTELVKEA